MREAILHKVAIGVAAVLLGSAALSVDVQARSKSRAAGKADGKYAVGHVHRGPVKGKIAGGQYFIKPRLHGHVADWGGPYFWDYDACWPRGAYRPWHWDCY